MLRLINGHAASRIRRNSSPHIGKLVLYPNEDDIAEWEEVRRTFPGLTREVVLEYEGSGCGAAIKYFGGIVGRVDFGCGLSQRFLAESALDVLMLCLQYRHLKEVVKGDKKLIEDLRMLHKFLISSIGHKGNDIIIRQYGPILFQIINNNLTAIHNEAKSIQLISQLIYIQYQLLGILLKLIAMSEMKTMSANEIINKSFEIVERFMKTSFGDELLEGVYEYPIKSSEFLADSVQGHIKIAACVSKPLFFLIHLKKVEAAPEFSLKYLCLHYLNEILQLMASHKIDIVKEKLMDLLLVVLKKALINFDKKMCCYRDVEIALNETAMGFTILKTISQAMHDPLELFCKPEHKQFFNSLFDSYTTSVIRHELIAFADAPFSSCRVVSYKSTYDYIAVLFKLFSALNELQGSACCTESPKAPAKFSMLAASEEFIGKLIKELDEVKGYKKGVRVVTDYIIEYLSDSAHSISRQRAECAVNLLSASSINFTAPATLASVRLAEPAESLRNRRVLATLKRTIEGNKFWAETILRHLVEVAKSKCGEEETMFGLCKLLYCAVAGEVCGNRRFGEIVFGKVVKTVDYKSYAGSVQRGESKAVKGFISIKGINTLMLLLRSITSGNAHKKRSENKAATILEGLILRLIEVPDIAEQLIDHPSTAMDFLNYPRSEVVAQFVGTLLKMAKFGYEENTCESVSAAAYFPSAIILHLTHILSEDDKEDEELGKAILLMKLVEDFLDQEDKVPLAKDRQALVSKNIKMKVMLKALKKKCSHRLIGKAVKRFLGLVCKLQLHNEEVAKQVCGPKALNVNKLCKFLKRLVINVSFVATIGNA